MKNNKGFAPIVLAIVILGVLALGGGAYYVGTKNSSILENTQDNNYPQENQNADSIVQGSVSKDTTKINQQDCNSTTVPYIKVLSPNGGETYTFGQQMVVKWKTCNVPSTQIFIEIYNPKTTALPLVDAINGIQNDGSETIILTDYNIISGQYELRIKAGGLSSGILLDSSDNLFTINTSSQGQITWKLYPDPSYLIYFHPTWTAASYLYQSVAQQAAGESKKQVGIIFTLSSGASVTWGGPQSFCNQSEFGAFVYGVSKLACVKNMRASLASNNQVDINAFGDFVLKNK